MHSLEWISVLRNLNTFPVPDVCYVFIKVQHSDAEFCMGIYRLGGHLSHCCLRVSLFKMHCFCFWLILWLLGNVFIQTGNMTWKEWKQMLSFIIFGSLLRWTQLCHSWCKGQWICPHLLFYWGSKCKPGVFWTNSCHCHFSKCSLECG